ncbi:MULTISPECIES: lysophospholipase [Francisella]|uniref:Lysophospholipase n=1 Tax=Francisella opportunistica TaxID=2016517 RepID=A0A345JR11_9GAMM|nr:MULTISPECIES: lysophospholipase [Francisella]APC91472.1 Lysophospholipase [Francisella sp. MA067296]AXH29757.1 lysophospholipase [Francisella opportunistica]AXH31407.1 lysophospholipase [Francisella opportunistica]AXH33052.1 lysophospholipase [Francisella opportunistica]
MKKTVLLSLILFCCLGHSNVVDTTTWKTIDVIKDFKTKYFCNENLSQQDCDKNINNIKQYGIDINSLGNTNIKNIQLDKIAYQTTNTFAATGKVTSKVSGLLMLPDTDSPKGVILYYHPTVFDNAGVPSNFSKDNQTSLIFNINYAAVYAANGYIVVAPDYIGQGDDYKNYHPYVLYPTQTVNTAVDLLNDVSNEIRKKYKLDTSAKINLFSVGYSEGGSYSIWSAKCLERQGNCQGVNKLEKLYKYRAAAGLSGAYDISHTTLDFMIDNNDSQKYALHSKLVTSMLKPGLMANTLMSYLHYSNVTKTISINDFDKGFFEMQCSTLPQENCNIAGKHYTFDSLFLQKHLPNKDFANAVFNSALYKKYPQQQSASHYAIPTGNNSMYDLFDEKIFSNPELIKTMQAADIVNFGEKTRTPLYLFALKEDSVVTRLNYDKFMKNANAIVDSFVLDNNKILTNTTDWLPVQLDINEVDHVTAEPYANLFAYNYINDLNKVYS